MFINIGKCGKIVHTETKFPAILTINYIIYMPRKLYRIIETNKDTFYRYLSDREGISVNLVTCLLMLDKYTVKC